MKAYIDFFNTFRAEFIGARKFKNRFIRLWGTEEIDDIEVMNKRFMIYPGVAEGSANHKNVKIMCKMLGIWKDVKDADFSPIAGFYLYFNPMKEKEKQEELSKDVLVSKIEEFCPLDTWFEATINYVDPSDPSHFDEWTKEQILDYLDNDYKKIFENGAGYVYGDTISGETLGKYVIFDDGSEFEVKVISDQITAIPSSSSNENWQDTSRLYTTGLSIDIKFKRIGSIDINGPVINAIKEEIVQERIAKIAKMQNSSFADFGESLGGLGPEGLSIFGFKISITNDIWYRSRLRVSVLNDTEMKTQDLLKLTLATLDTDQIKKKVSFWKKALGFFLSVIAIVASFLFPVGMPFALALAVYTGIAITIMTLIQIQWAKTNAAAAAYMGRWIQFASIVSLVVGISAVIENIGKNIALQATKESLTSALVAEGAEATVASATVEAMSAEQVFAIAGNMGIEATASSISLSGLVNMAKTYIVNNIKSIGMKIFQKVVSMRQADMRSQLQDRREEDKELEEELSDMTDKNMNIAMEDIVYYTKNLDRIKSRYDFDYEFEGEPATMNIGNILRSSFNKGKGNNLRAENLV